MTSVSQRSHSIAPALLSIISAKAAIPVAFVQIGVCLIVSMAAWAMGNRAVSCTSNFWSNTTPDIFCSGHQFKMSRPNAITSSAQMVPFKTLWWFSGKEMMGEDVLTENLILTVAFVIAMGQPDSAAVGAAGVNLLPKGSQDFFLSILTGHRKITPSGVMRTAALTARPPFILQGVGA